MVIDPSLSFSSFVFAPSNRLAAEAARKVAELPAAVYNPLVIIGQEGSGKTHLLHAIANEARSLRPEDAAVLVRAADFVEGASDPRGLLLVDDLHLLPDSREPQNKLISACRVALVGGAQLVLTCTPPLTGFLRAEIGQLLAGGLLVELEPTDRELAAALLPRFTGAAGVDLSAEASAELVARRLAPGDLQQVVGRIRDELGSDAGEISRETLRNVLDGPRPGAGGPFDEFGSFLEDVGRVVALAVESAPWRKKLGEAIRAWEAEGIRTERLEKALEADFSSDVDGLIGSFGQDAARLIEIRQLLGESASGQVLDDPDRLQEVETLLTRRTSAPVEAVQSSRPAADVFRTVDPWFLDSDRIVLDAFDVEGRIPGDRR